MYKAIIIPSEIFTEGEKFFKNQTLLKGQKILENGRVAISFAKDRETRFIVSGIVTDVDPFQVKVNNNNTDPENPTLTSQCGCHHWSEENHCSHTAALYLHYKLSKINKSPSFHL